MALNDYGYRGRPPSHFIQCLLWTSKNIWWRRQKYFNTTTTTIYVIFYANTFSNQVEKVWWRLSKYFENAWHFLLANILTLTNALLSADILRNLQIYKVRWPLSSSWYPYWLRGPGLPQQGGEGDHGEGGQAGNTHLWLVQTVLINTELWLVQFWWILSYDWSSIGEYWAMICPVFLKTDF